MKKKFPHYHQLNAMDCGPACLRMVARSYGKHYSLETLRNRSFITREGVSMLGIAEAAETIGFRTMGIKTSLNELKKQRPLPCILHWNQNHFVVLYEIKKNKRTGTLFYYIADPSSQRIRYTEEDFLKCWAYTKSPQGNVKGSIKTLQ